MAAVSLLPLAAFRLIRRRGIRAWGWTALAAAAVLPVAVSLGSAELGPRLAEPALALLLAAGAGVVAIAFSPSEPSPLAPLPTPPALPHRESEKNRPGFVESFRFLPLSR